ncbi:MAG TPA: hypothetical protein PKV72_04385, partial [Candidatus Peribacteria bacterium]|nr:hypothetical protein [Candidatus Peribacteria bacterium]
MHFRPTSAADNQEQRLLFQQSGPETRGPNNPEVRPEERQPDTSSRAVVETLQKETKDLTDRMATVRGFIKDAQLQGRLDQDVDAIQKRMDELLKNQGDENAKLDANVKVHVDNVYAAIRVAQESLGAAEQQKAYEEKIERTLPKARAMEEALFSPDANYQEPLKELNAALAEIFGALPPGVTVAQAYRRLGLQEATATNDDHPDGFQIGLTDTGVTITDLHPIRVKERQDRYETAMDALDAALTTPQDPLMPLTEIAALLKTVNDTAAVTEGNAAWNAPKVVRANPRWSVTFDGKRAETITTPELQSMDLKTVGGDLAAARRGFTDPMSIVTFDANNAMTVTP